MLHWTPKRFAPATAAIAPLREGLLGQTRRTGSARSDHARMLAHAAARRRAASGEDRGYWLACAPAAVARAASLRGTASFARLP